MIEARDDAERMEVMDLERPVPANSAGQDLSSPQSEAVMGRLRDAASALSLYASADLSDAAMDLWGDYQFLVTARMFPDKPDRAKVYQQRFIEHAGAVLTKIAPSSELHRCRSHRSVPVTPGRATPENVPARALIGVLRNSERHSCR